MEDPKYLDLMSKYLSGNIDRAEREELLSWAGSSAANQAFFDEMIQLWSMTGDAEEELFPIDTAAAWDRLEEKIDTPDSQSGGGGPVSERIIPFYARRSSWLVAAGLALLLSLGWFVYPMLTAPDTVVASTASEEKQEVLLPDGTKVWLNESSTLSYDPRFTDRRVELSGEAYFDVATIPGREFTIRSGTVQTRVLGTIFNVRAYPEEELVEVTVEEGLVEVSLAPESAQAGLQVEPVRLEPGKSGLIDIQNSDISVVAEDISLAKAWKDQKLIFDDAPMPRVAKTLERYFDIQIEMDAANYRDCPVTFEKDNPRLEEVLTLLEALFDYQIVARDSLTYELSGGVCQ